MSRRRRLVQYVSQTRRAVLVRLLCALLQDHDSFTPNTMLIFFENIIHMHVV